jgi:hypothetical protein
MAAQKQTRGACGFCGREFTRTGMSRHLGSCEKRREAVEKADQQPGTPGRFIRLQVRDADAGEYWLNLEMDGSATMKKLDQYLRAIWLECCGHMSEFTAGGWGSQKVAMSRKAADVLRPGVELVHTYDFGTETVTLLSVQEVREGNPTTSKPIALLARNQQPIYSCQECDDPASVLCLECAYEDEEPGTLCAAHAKGHPHDDYGEPMPLVNSPRVGQCGYTGPAEPPY